ncbi:uncharacterized protein LOC130531976 [Takifugu flavidus]|uniref:uncharacterized protein LOC130531976 n=1 Tax=Takifugu flavidus TaxID=433684 RepID=UPI0025442B6E|nr:uncharacterized protein LOC130531976 [Takifugu flavidus]XP_056900140.1 uncharacterized protein LOC130531976 [Takifugu flavidus]
MSCVEKRHMNHRMGSMLHHRFPNGFTDLFMDENDREVSTLTDRAFRSLCVGDDAAYNDDFLYGYSPFNCHKPLAGEPKTTRRKESKKRGNSKADKNFVQHQESLSHMSSFLKALSATGESCEGMLIKNGDVADSKGESWDKSALRSIQRELSEFSSDYRSLKDAGFPTEKCSKKKNGKSTVKLKKLNIRNFFFHSEFSPFQTWRDLNQFHFGPECTVLPTDNIPTWYDMRFYKELTETHRKDTLHGKEEQSCQNVTVDPSPIAPKPTPPSPPSEIPKKPTATQAEKSSSSDGGDENAAPWRRNRPRTKSVIPNSQAGVPPQENSSKPMDDGLPFLKKQVQSVEVKAVEEVSSTASTPFSICQLMTPLIPSRQPTETSEILQSILSPSIQDLPVGPHCEAKLTPELPIKRDSYKSLASSILFNLKDNRKRVKSRYSPPKFKTSEVSGGETQSPKSDHLKLLPVSSEGNASGLSTPAIPKDGRTVCSPVFESSCTPTENLPIDHTEMPLLDDYLLSNLLQSKREAVSNSGVDENNPVLPFIQSNTRNAKAKKQNYPTLNLYRKASQGDTDVNYPQVSPSSKAPLQISQQVESNGLLSLMINSEISPKVQRKNTALSPNVLKVNNKDYLPMISEESLDLSARKILPIVPDQSQQLAKENRERCSGEQLDSSGRQDSNRQPMSTRDVAKAAKEAIHAAKSKALSAIQVDSVNISDREEVWEREADRWMAHSGETQSSRRKTSVQENSKLDSANEAMLAGKKVKKAPPPVPKKRFANSDVHLSLDKHQEHNAEKLSNGKCSETNLDLLPGEEKYVQKPDKAKHLFSTRQNSYIKSQRYSLVDDENRVELDVGDRKVDKRTEVDEERLLPGEMKDSGHIINDLHALKALERARRRDRVKLGLVNIDEEAKAKNDLISRELKNIKKGMLSMRGNTLAKRDLFAKKDREQNKHVFTKTDNNVIRNRALVNENYDKAKTALEDFMSEREKKKNQLALSDESGVQRLTQGKDSLATEDEKPNVGTQLQKDLKEKIGDMRDHNPMIQVLAQTEPLIRETHIPGCPGRDNNPDTVLIGRDKLLDDDPVDPSCGSEEKESGRNLFQEPEDNKGETPPVPPRSKKAGNRRDSSVLMEVDSMTSVAANEIYDGQVHLAEFMGEKWETQAAVQQSTNEALLSRNKTDSDKERGDGTDKTKFTISADLKQAFELPSQCPQSENKFETQFLSEGISQNKNKSRALQADTIETTFKNANENMQRTRSQKKNAPFLPNASDDTITKNLVPEEPDKMNGENVRTTEGAEASKDTLRDVISPLLSINGTGITQNPPDQSSQSSKSSYFSVESALHRNAEADVYHSLENLTGEAEFSEEPGNMPKNMKTALDYYCLSDPEIESEDTKGEINVTSQKEKELCQEESTDGETRPPDQGGIPVSPPTTFSPPLEIPALFKVKDNTAMNKKNTTHPWSPRGSLSGSERGEEETHRFKENPDLPLINEPIVADSTVTVDDTFSAQQSSSNIPTALLHTPSMPQGEKLEGFLTVPQEEDRFSGVSPSSALESLTTSAADTGDETGLNSGVSKVPSERSGSTCSGNDSQIGLPKPPAVLPKSEKAVLRAIKLTNRRMKKDVQRSTHKPAQSSGSSSSRQRAEGHQSDKTEHKSSNTKNSKNGGKHTEREKPEAGQHHNRSCDKNIKDEGKNSRDDRRGRSETRHRATNDTGPKTRRQSTDSVEGSSQSGDPLLRGATERQGRSSNRHVPDKPQQRHYSTDRVISNVPVYKAHSSQRSTPDRTFQRSQSIDRYMADRAERRLSTDMLANEKLDPRTQCNEKSIMEGFQQRGRSRDKVSREHPLRRSHSIDVYGSDVAHPSTLSRQSSHTSKFSRQPSIEHAIVTQSFPVTQRKLLQDPDSGQYFFVDMPIQVKTKTFFDPETGSYLQLPVQPPEGAVTQASALEVLTPPVVVYHSFVPVPLSPLAQNGTIQATHTAPQDFEQRHTEKSQQMHSKDRQLYLEPVYAQHDHTLGEFRGTEELDCLS